MNVQYASRVVREIVDRALWGENDFTVVDVGASGGIAEMWSGFEPRLAGVGFDPLVENMRQMAEAEKRPKLRYEAAFVGCHDDDSAAPPAQWALGLSPRLQPDPFPRTSSAAAQEKHQFDYVGRVYNNSDDFKVSTRFVTLDDYFPLGTSIDFLKIDTDGSDYQVLRGADRLLTEGAVLGILVEVPFHGQPGDDARSFANIDHHLRARGFTLYNLDSHRYSRAALPGLFSYDAPASTLTGQVVWADALYFRDVAAPGQEHSGYTLTRERLLKLVALLDLFGLPDCAAEALLAHPTLTTTEERTCLLNLLVMATGFSGTYDDHIRRFESDLESFYPRAYDQDARFLPPERRIALLKQESRTLKRRVADYKLKLDIERQRCARLRAKLKKLQTEQG